MPAFFTQGFFVREPAWHGLGVVLDDYPDRDTAMHLAGHDWDVKLAPVARAKKNEDGSVVWKRLEGWNAHVRSDNGLELTIKPDTFERIPNSVAYEIAEILFDEGFQYETGITLDEGRQCAITLKLDEPVVITGDDSVTLPYGCLSWAHDGSGALKVRTGMIRQVCANTVAASEAEGKRLQTDFTFRHTKNVADRIADAKNAVKGLRQTVDVFVKAMEDLARIRVTPEQRDLFVSTIIGDKGGVLSTNEAISSRVKSNLETERAKINSLFFGPTIPEEHRLTGYGLFQAGGEYFDHLRRYQSKDSYVRRTLLSDNPAKANLNRTIRELVAA